MTPQQIQNLITRGFIILPMAGKRPLVRWKHYTERKPSVAEMVENFTGVDYDGAGLLTGHLSGVICADYDAPPYPTRGAYTETPSGGRHYWHPHHPSDKHGIRVTEHADIPYIVRLYAEPIINDWQIPIKAGGDANNFRQSAFKRSKSRFWLQELDPPGMEHLNQCAFIAWFKEKRRDETWDGRYALARGYASNAAKTRNPDLFLGKDYQHQDDIVNRISAPHSCNTIVKAGYHCQHFQDGCCSISGATTPYGLATVRQRQDTRRIA